jgi:hypothetical protein
MLWCSSRGFGNALLDAEGRQDMIDDCREGVKRNFELAQGKAAELGTLPEMMSSAAFADFGPDRRAMVRTIAITSHHHAHNISCPHHH